MLKNLRNCVKWLQIMEIELFGKQLVVTDEEFNVLKNKHNLSVDEDGNLIQTENIGVIPKLLSTWFRERKEMRKLSKKYHDEGNKELEEYYDRKQYSWKILLNSMYGTLGLCVWRFYDKDNAEAVTLSGVTIVQTTAKLINQYYRGITKSNDDYVIYSDTDSIAGDSKIKINGESIRIDHLFEKLKINNEDFIEDIMNRQFIFPKNLILPFFDENNNEIKEGKVQYIEKHKIKKKCFRIKTKFGKFIDVSEDHSIMVMENGKLLKKKPSQLEKYQKIIIIN